MKNIVILVMVASLAWFGYAKYQRVTGVQRQVAAHDAPVSSFKCDGRTRCPQMRSCEEATYFVQHCPDTKMDGDDDGVPCEQQWCN